MNMPDPEMVQNFNIIIIAETTQVLYDEEGNPYANWNNP